MVNVGVIGCGYWGPKHVRNFHELEEAQLTMVCDLDEDRLERVKTQYPYVETALNPKDLLRGNVDAVVIATPVGTHYQLAKKALLHDKHVLIEKPVSTSSREVLDLIELADKRNLIVMVGHTYEYHPAVDFLRELVQSGELGDIYNIDASRLNLGLFRPDANVLWDLAPHDICIVLSLLDDEPIEVSARGSHHIDPHLCDVAYIELLFASGTMCNVHVSWLHPRKIRELTIVGSKKMAVYDDVSEAEKIHIYDKGLAVAASTNNNGFATWPPNYHYGDVVIPFITNAEPLKLECSHFIQSIVEGIKPRSDGLAGLRVTSILEAANRSLLNGGEREKLTPTRTIAEASKATIS
ncbi:MAG: Gfo/Idh/MocA family oxidoreductase [Dehalococcoidales bacterium]|nr:MAG: Gfo/Idh/MocA family oxidoreductase [Dehalococcoidales bacterium]